MFYYTAFGLAIASEIEFPELVRIDEHTAADVKIRFGATPKEIPGAAYAANNFWITPTQCLQYIKDVAYYFAENGDTVTVDACEGADLKSLRIYLLCSSMAAIVHQRGFIPLHASGIFTNGRSGTALLIGDSGAGKSTTIKALSQKGYSLFTDDVCVIRIKNGTAEGVPSYPVMKLWENSYRLLNLGSTKEEDKLWSDVEKFGVYFHEHFVSEWTPVRNVFVLEKSDDVKEVTAEKLTGVQAFTALGSNTYRGWYVEPMKLNALHFGIISKLAEQCEVYKITRPAEGESLAAVIDTIEKTLHPVS